MKIDVIPVKVDELNDIIPGPGSFIVVPVLNLYNNPDLFP
jgi:hypothetical protein